MIDKLVSIETVKGLFRLMPANMPFEIAECLLNERLNALPAVPQEMSAQQYGDTWKKICKQHSNEPCDAGCPLGKLESLCCCSLPTEETIPIVENWAREHPEERSEE